LLGNHERVLGEVAVVAGKVVRRYVYLAHAQEGYQYLVTFPDESRHQAVIEHTRFMSVAEVDELLKKLGPVPVARPPRKPAIAYDGDSPAQSDLRYSGWDMASIS
jgi:hypothetical protein